MKYIIQFSLMAFLGSIMFAFISIENETVYSCDPEIDAFVKDNLLMFKYLSRENTIKYDRETQIAIWRTWDTEKKISVFRKKVYQDAEEFEGEKKEFILEYANDHETNRDKQAIELLGFETAKNIFTRLETLAEQRTIAKAQPTGGGGGSNTKSCQCSIQSDFCSTSCMVQRCKKTFGGCGTFLWYDCNGNCSAQ